MTNSLRDNYGKQTSENDIILNRQAKIIDICSKLEQGGSKMTQSNDNFELTNCPDPECFICVKKMRGYPSELNLHPFHKEKAANSMKILLDWMGRVA